MHTSAAGKRVLIVGHADGDGHVIAEHSRRNCMAEGALTCEVFIDPRKTGSYRFWEKYLGSLNFTEYDLVVFCDLMLNPRQPERSVNALIEVAANNPGCEIVVIDHHLFHLDLSVEPDNLLFHLTDSVYECCYGEPSDLMRIACICEKQTKDFIRPVDELEKARAVGVTRAASDPTLAGQPLIALLRNERWQVIESLAMDHSSVFQMVRGRRRNDAPVSANLASARELATSLVAKA